MALNVAAHLDAAIATDDPWQLSSNVFELRRYAIILDMMLAHKPDPNTRFENALEVGCAAGVFTQMMYPHCKNMHVIDVMPRFIEKAQARMGERPNITWEVASVTDAFADGKTFDLIVVAEVLCYIAEPDVLRRVVERLASLLVPGGLLVFGGAIDTVVRRWGMPGVGAESTMLEWQRVLRETNRAACIGAYWGEDSRILSYTRDEHAIRDISSAVDPEDFIPQQATRDIQAAGVLVLAAHPGDAVQGCGGAVMRHVAAGTSVSVAVATGALSPRTASEFLHKSQEDKAAEILGYKDPSFWAYPRAKLAYGEALISRILASLGAADLIYAPSLADADPDRRILSLAAVEAVRRRAGVRIAFYEIGIPQRPNLLLDISDLVSRKREAMGCFTSQPGRADQGKRITALNSYRAITLPESCDAAEAYLIYSSEELNADPLKLHRLDNEKHLAEAQFARKEVNRVRQQLQEREAELKGLYGSTSWKITAPLRFARRLLRRSA